MSKVWGLWNGGVNYSEGDMQTDLEVFNSRTHAGDELSSRARYGGRYRQTFTHADGSIDLAYTPNADEGCAMWVYLSDPRESSDPMPDYVLTIGPRGGIKTERV